MLQRIMFVSERAKNITHQAIDNASLNEMATNWLTQAAKWAREIEQDSLEKLCVELRATLLVANGFN